jgi:glycerol-3-phosphate dehydrogenase
MSIAEYLVAAMRDAGFVATEKVTLPPPPRMPTLGEASLRPFADPVAIANDPAYGEIVCFCERVTAGEIRDALSSVIPATSLSGLRKRTRATNGRCQGFYCGAEVQARLDAAVEGQS